MCYIRQGRDPVGASGLRTIQADDNLSGLPRQQLVFIRGPLQSERQFEAAKAEFERRVAEQDGGLRDVMPVAAPAPPAPHRLHARGECGTSDRDRERRGGFDPTTAADAPQKEKR